MSSEKAITATLAFFLLSGLWVTEAPSQQISNLDRGRAQVMLEEISKDIAKNYYDPNFHGVNWDATVAKAKEGSRNRTHSAWRSPTSRKRWIR